MGREVNIDSILALDERIKEITAELVRLKHTRNSLLNVARIPPEILGHIFHLNVIPEAGEGHFPELRKGSYNFLLICHHWFQVARNTPELWTFWGNNLEDWRRRYLFSGPSTPVDLVLNGFLRGTGPFDEVLRDVLRDRAARGVIRKVHIKCPGEDHLTATAVISSLTPEDERIRHSHTESITLSGVDASNFLARHHFPKLRDLYLFRNFKISCWDHLISHTMALVNLSLTSNDVTPPFAIPTTSQILSLLASNPNIRTLVLHWLVISDDSENGSTSPVPLFHLEELSLVGRFHHIFPILHRLELPERIHNARLELYHCTLEEAYETVRPYIRDYLRRDPRFNDRLGVFTSTTADSFLLRACTVGIPIWDGTPPHNPPYVMFRVTVPGAPWEDMEELFIDTLALLPRESVVFLEVNLLAGATEEMITEMPNIKYLNLVNTIVWPEFLLPYENGPGPRRKLLPSLQWLGLEDVKAEDDDWSPLVTYLAHQTSGDQAVSIKISGEGLHICADVLDQIYELVSGIYYIPDPDVECPSNECPAWEGGALIL